MNAPQGRCSACRSWTRNPHWILCDGKWGKCKRADTGLASARFRVAGLNLLGATIETRENFGCVHFVPRKPPEF